MDTVFFDRLRTCRTKCLEEDKYRLVFFKDNQLGAIPQTPFRVFEPIPLDRETSRKMNNRASFDIYLHTLFDYPFVVQHHLKASQDALRHFGRFLTIEVVACPFMCWHCYRTTPHEDLNSASTSSYRAMDIVRLFAQVSRHVAKADESLRVLRISGGEPFLVVDLIAEVLRIITEDRESFEEDLRDHLPECVWTETNLAPWAPGPDGRSLVELIDDENPGVLNALRRHQDRLIIHPCFHGLEDGNIAECTGIESGQLTMADLLAGFRKLHELGFTLYPTFIPEACDPDGVTGLFKSLYEIDQRYPLQTALIQVDYYPQAVQRLKMRSRKKGFRFYSRFAGLDRWRRLLQKHYGVDYAQVPRYLAGGLVSLQKPGQPVTEDDHKYRPCLVILKSTSRQEYRREILTIIGAPFGYKVRESYDLVHVESSLRQQLVARSPDSRSVLRDARAIIVYTEPNRFVWLPIRFAKVCDVTVTGSLASFDLELQEYVVPSHEGSPDEQGIKNFASNAQKKALDYFGASVIRCATPQMAWIVLGEEKVFEDFQQPAPEADGWGHLMRTIPYWPDAEQLRNKENIFIAFRVTESVKTFPDSGGQGSKSSAPKSVADLVLREGEELRCQLVYVIPRFDTYQQNGGSVRPITSRMLVIASSTPSLVVEGYQPHPLAKYGVIDFTVRCGRLECDIPAQVVVRAEDHSPFCPRFTLDVKLKKESASGC